MKLILWDMKLPNDRWRSSRRFLIDIQIVMVQPWEELDLPFPPLLLKRSNFHSFMSVIAFEVREPNPLFVLGVLCIIGFPVQLIGDDFLRLHFRRRHTFASLWGACLRFASLWRANDDDANGSNAVILVSSAFIFQRLGEVWYSVFVKRSSFKRFAESS